MTGASSVFVHPDTLQPYFLMATSRETNFIIDNRGNPSYLTDPDNEQCILNMNDILVKHAQNRNISYNNYTLSAENPVYYNLTSHNSFQG